jgi:hypothetical protein
MVAILWIINIVLFAVCREQRTMKKYPSGVIEQTLLVSIRTQSGGHKDSL